ncbi:MAG: MaoC family dehydratase N-terminal domain-containing protein [Nitratireductor sp.]|nr:MaoC family dehydratase N-terminal domain-containing protein [Nitratireductor sp.]
MATAQKTTIYGTINDEAMETLRRRMNVVHPIEEPFVRYINADSIRHAARAIGDSNPMWIDPEHAAKSRFGKLMAPPAILYGVSWGSWDMRRGEGLPGVHGLHARDRWTYYRPLLEGDEVSATKKLVGLEEKRGSYSGKAVMQIREFNFGNQRGEAVARCQMSALRVERHVGKGSNKYANTPKAKYTDEEIANIDDEVAAEIVRGSDTRYWEDVEVGEKMQPVVRGPLSVSDMIAWMMGMGSPHIRSGQYWLDYRRRTPKVAVPDPETRIPQAVERVHWDPFLAAEIGMPAPYDYGAQRGAWGTHLVTNWAGDDGWVAEVDIQYRGMNFLGDTIWLSGEVVDKWRGARTGTGYVETSIACINQRGENIMPGKAIVALPDRDRPLPNFPIDPDADLPGSE